MLLGVNMQTSFMHPPFGFALFYLRSVAPAKDYLDKVTGRLTARVTTGQIYWGAVPFVLIQIVMIALVIAFPQMVMVYKAKESDRRSEQDPDPAAPERERSRGRRSPPGAPATEAAGAERARTRNRKSLEDAVQGALPVAAPQRKSEGDAAKKKAPRAGPFAVLRHNGRLFFCRPRSAGSRSP